MKKQLLAGTVAIVAVSTGCSAEDLIEKAAEEAIEKGIESETGEDIELDFDLNSEDGSMTITGDDGETVINFDGGSENGSLTITGDDGESTYVAGQELVEGWPSEYPLPDGVSVINSTKIKDGEGTLAYSVTFEGDISFEEALTTFDTYEGGAEPATKSDTTYESLRSAHRSYKLETDSSLTVSLAESDDGKIVGTVVLLGVHE